MLSVVLTAIHYKKIGISQDVAMTHGMSDVYKKLFRIFCCCFDCISRPHICFDKRKNSKHLATKPADLTPIPSADVNSRWLTWCSMHFMAKVDIPYSTKTPSTGFLCVHLDSITCDLKNKKSSSCPRELWELQDFYWEIHGGFFERTKNSEACGMSLKVQCTCCTENRPVTCFFLYFLRVKS